MIDIDFESESSAEKELKRFLEANPNSIGLPPLTSNSMPNLNPAADLSEDRDRIQGAWRSLDSKTLLTGDLVFVQILHVVVRRDADVR